MDFKPKKRIDALKESDVYDCPIAIGSDEVRQGIDRESESLWSIPSSIRTYRDRNYIIKRADCVHVGLLFTSWAV